ncbi:MAG: PilZ domain-containing protein [Spirochaetales bacterium]|nr:PilZ domain-containing protein [Spirochaetales bacterium]
MTTPNTLSLFGSWFAGPGEIVFLSAMILLLAGITGFSYFFYKNKQRQEHSRLMKKKFDTYLLRLNLNDRELAYIMKLTAFLDSEDLKYHMLTDRRTFSSCADSLGKKEKPPEGLRAELEKKLNFPAKTVSANYFSSEELPVGMPALIILNETNKFTAEIEENRKDALRLKIKKQIPPLQEGTPLNVYFHDNQKIFTINTNVLEQKENWISVSHSLLQSQKRRAFKRRRVKLPVMVKHLDMDDMALHSYITDISEGGASLENPDFQFRKHDRIILYYHIDTDEGFQIRGEVLRLSAKGRIIHISFLDRDLTIRSRIKTIVK